MNFFKRIFQEDESEKRKWEVLWDRYFMMKHLRREAETMGLILEDNNVPISVLGRLNYTEIFYKGQFVGRYVGFDELLEALSKFLDIKLSEISSLGYTIKQDVISEKNA